MDERYETFESVEERLQAIADEVAREDLSLDEALELYEEAAQLARHACTLSEEGIKALYPPEEPEGDEAQGQAADDAEGQGAAEGEGRGAGQEPLDDSMPAAGAMADSPFAADPASAE